MDKTMSIKLIKEKLESKTLDAKTRQALEAKLKALENNLTVNK